METLISTLAQELGQKPQYVESVITLLDEGNTIPFIARYRKELHGGMDDTTLRNLETRLTYLRNLQERKEEIIRSIEGQDKLTPELQEAILAAKTLAEAEDAVRSMMADKVFGASGDHVVIEEFLTGPEVSVLAFTDGKTLVPMVSSMDHKRALDNDEGLNTGGMGTVAPNPYYTADIADECMKTIFLPTMEAMTAEGRTFKGCLYFGLMLTPKGPKVIEYNCRFGDPETQVVLPLLESDLLTVMQAVTEERLSEVEVKFATDRAAACVIMASKGYPAHYEKGFEITIPADVADSVYVAGAVIKDGKTVTSGGRVLGVTAVADTLAEALTAAYGKVEKVHFDNAYYRRDIGQKALKAR